MTELATLGIGELRGPFVSHEAFCAEMERLLKREIDLAQAAIAKARAEGIDVERARTHECDDRRHIAHDITYVGHAMPQGETWHEHVFVRLQAADGSWWFAPFLEHRPPSGRFGCSILPVHRRSGLSIDHGAHGGTRVEPTASFHVTHGGYLSYEDNCRIDHMGRAVVTPGAFAHERREHALLLCARDTAGRPRCTWPLTIGREETSWPCSSAPRTGGTTTGWQLAVRILGDNLVELSAKHGVPPPGTTGRFTLRLTH